MKGGEALARRVRAKNIDMRAMVVHALFEADRNGRVMFLVHNERTKLTAAWLNTLATAVVAAGAIAPITAVFYGLSTLPTGRGLMIAIALGCTCGGGVIHLAGRTWLRRMRE